MCSKCPYEAGSVQARWWRLWVSCVLVAAEEAIVEGIDPMDAALIVACISGAVALVSAAFSMSTQLKVTKLQTSTQLQVPELESKLRVEERQSQDRSAAKVVLDRYRGPLLDAAWLLGDRVDNIRNREFFKYLAEGNDRKENAKLSTLFRLAYYPGWREFIRSEVQLLRFENEDDTRLTASFLNNITWVLASDKLDGTWAMLWGDEQRGIGELMIEKPSETSSIVRGHAAFHRDYDKVFALWMERLARDLISTAAVTRNRLQLLQWALYGLVRQLDEECTYSDGWIYRTAAELGHKPPAGSVRKSSEQLMENLALIERRTSSLSVVGIPARDVLRG
jgi:hypothetical protein